LLWSKSGERLWRRTQEKAKRRRMLWCYSFNCIEWLISPPICFFYIVFSSLLVVLCFHNSWGLSWKTNKFRCCIWNSSSIRLSFCWREIERCGDLSLCCMDVNKSFLGLCCRDVLAKSLFGLCIPFIYLINS
jgi:hypothetical protein